MHTADTGPVIQHKFVGTIGESIEVGLRPVVGISKMPPLRDFKVDECDK
jgi:hypothetical protein